MTQRIIAALALALLVFGGRVAASAAEGGPQVTPPSGLVARGKLTYGVAATFPPFEYHAEEGGLTGFDIEMMARLAEYMGLEPAPLDMDFDGRSEEHTSELQSRENLVCRLLLEKKNTS